MANTQTKLNRQGQQYIEGLRQTVKALWSKMCEEDGIPPDSKFVVFNDDTNKKYASFYNNALIQHREATSQYRAGGYVGLKIINGKAS